MIVGHGHEHGHHRSEFLCSSKKERKKKKNVKEKINCNFNTILNISIGSSKRGTDGKKKIEDCKSNCKMTTLSLT